MPATSTSLSSWPSKAASPTRLSGDGLACYLKCPIMTCRQSKPLKSIGSYTKAFSHLSLTPNLIWIETVNEVDKDRTEWLAEFSLEMARLTMADGFKYAAFSWSSGTPEPETWEGPKMLEFLELVGQHPDRLAIALHEYSFEIDSIAVGYPFLVGRFQKLFRAADTHHIPRPTVLITEWGWEAYHIPTVSEAMEDIRWAGWLYAAYPQVKGAATWYLGCCFGNVHNQTQKLIAPVGTYSIGNYFAITPGSSQINENIFIPNPPTN